VRGQTPSDPASPLILGLTGPNAAGKGEVARYLAGAGFAVHSLSDIIREEAAARGLPPEREHLIRIGNALRRAGGSGVLAERTLPRLDRPSVVDSIRNPAEVAVLRSLPRFFLLGVRAPTELRFQRCVARGRVGDPETIDRFRERERQENSTDPQAQQLEATFRQADRVVENTGDLSALQNSVEELLAGLGAAARSG
jgi:dephospho-CoA kinase